LLAVFEGAGFAAAGLVAMGMLAAPCFGAPLADLRAKRGIAPA
jgi:hypothetical protein